MCECPCAASCLSKHYLSRTESQHRCFFPSLWRLSISSGAVSLSLTQLMPLSFSQHNTSIFFLTFTFSIKRSRTSDQHNGPFLKSVGLVRRREANGNASANLRRSSEWLPGNVIKPGHEREQPRDGDSSWRSHHAARCPQLKSFVGCTLKRRVFKCLMATGGCARWGATHPEKVPLLWDTKGGREDPKSHS